MTGILDRLRQRKLVQWTLAYLAFAFALLQGVDIIAQRFAWPESIERLLILVLALGFCVALVLSWYHGERGAQKVSGTELTILAVLLAIGGGLLWQVRPGATGGPTAPVSADASAAKDPPAVPAPDKSIAVLPFENLSDDKANAYFATGMQDEILTRLAGIHDLKVISRTSTEQYASHPPNLRIVAEQLGVATVLEGSVQKAAGKVRINLQLIDAHSDSHLWAQNYDRDLKDVFAVQSDVAAQVADALKAQLLPAETERIASVPTRNVQAHDLYLQALSLFQQLQTSSANDPAAVGKQATLLYQQAIAADPQFALAYAQLSYLQSYLHWYNVDSRPVVVALADSAARQALALRPGLPEGHLALGYVHYWGHRDYAAALAEFAIARAGMPNSAEVIAAIAYVHRRQGLSTRGIPELRQAEVLDPRDSTIPREIANSYTALRLYPEADAAFARSLAIFPGDIEAQEQRATTRMMTGDLASAQRMADAIPKDSDPQGSVSLLRFKLAMVARDPNAALAAIQSAPQWLMTRWEHSVVPLSLLRAQALAMKGNAAGARAAFVEAQAELQRSMDNPGATTDALGYLGLAYAGLGDKNKALQSANSAATQMSMTRDPIVGAFQLERLARVEAQVGDASNAIVHLQQLMQAVGGETVSIATLRIDPAWDALRGDPRFQALLRKYQGTVATDPTAGAAHG